MRMSTRYPSSAQLWNGLKFLLTTRVSVETANSRFSLTGVYSHSGFRPRSHTFATWSSADESIATVDSNGVMSPISDGVVSIRRALKDKVLPKR